MTKNQKELFISEVCELDTEVALIAARCAKKFNNSIFLDYANYSKQQADKCNTKLD